MKMQESEINEAFRAEVREWMGQHLTGRFAPLKHASGLGAEGYDAQLAKEWEQELAKGGWTGLGWETQYGGRNLPLAQQVIFHEEYVRCGGPGRIGHIGETLLAPTLMAYGTPEQKARFLPGILAGTDYWAQGYSEPGAGSDLAAIRTKARRDESTGEWVIDGQKVWTSWAHESEWIFVLARTEEGSARHAGLSLLLVPIRQAGVEVRPIRQITGTSEFNEVFFDGARTDGALHLGPVGDGWKVAMYLLG
ncbi:MAG: acyl-CoA dehydrogenase family protein, partial [Comamonas sp.]|nr:acyl-CoA dehydrogenase family protein [Comamonas sp.]